MGTHVAMQQAEQRQDWSSLPSWGAPPQSCGGGNTWSRRLSAMADDDNDSWEVRAFAEDASSSGQWPPRSYACSFCRRGFRTAQALGGHMNVHRRERQEANKLRTEAAAAAAAAAAKSHRQVDALPNRDWDLASLTYLLGRQASPITTTEELLSPLSPQSLKLSLSTWECSKSRAEPSPESISSSSGIPADILCESLRKGRASWSSERGFHPYERSGLANLARFSIVPEDTPAMDLELRLGRSFGEH